VDRCSGVPEFLLCHRIIFYGFPVFLRVVCGSAGFTRAQVTQGFFLGFLIVGLPFGLVAGAVIDRVGAKWVILAGVALVGTSCC